jgi:hypothetical protein
MKISDRYEFMTSIVYCFFNELSADERQIYGESAYVPVMDDLLFLRVSGAIDEDMFRVLWNSAGVTSDLAAEYVDLILGQHAIADIDDKLRICVETLKSGENLSLTKADEISLLEGVKIVEGGVNERYFVFDTADVIRAALFGLEFMLHVGTDIFPASSEILTAEGLKAESEKGHFVYPKDYEKMSYVCLLHDQSQFMEEFSKDYISGEKTVTPSLRAEYDEFLKKMNAVFRVTLYSRVKSIFSTPKKWECKVLEQDVQIRLDTYSDDVKAQTMIALERFTQMKTVKSGQILQITIDNTDSAYLYTVTDGTADFTPLMQFYNMPVDPDKIWSVLSKYRLVSSYTEHLPIEIAEQLSDEEQHYAKIMIAWQAKVGIEKIPVTKTSTLADRLKYMQDNNVLAMLKNVKELGKIGRKPTAKLD